MSNNAHIDKIFKEGLGEISSPDRDAMWQRMEGMIDGDHKKRKKRFAAIVLFACLFTAGFFITQHFTAKQEGLIQTEAPQLLTMTNNIVKDPAIVPGNAVTAASNTHSTVALKLGTSKKRVVYSANQHVAMAGATTDEFPGAITVITNELLSQKMTADLELIPLQQVKQQPQVAIAPVALVVQKSLNNTRVIAKPAEAKKPTVTPRKITIEAIAGCDALRMNRKAGYYAGIRVNKLLEKGTVISVGLNYTSHTVNDRYRLSSKPAEQRWETDAKINDIRTIRVPIYFQRQLANTKFALMAGLVPTYVIDASFYNVPSSFTGGDPNQYRKFTLKEMNRFNILFGTGIKYSPVKRLSFELSGSYGFTSLVKNSYINQSRVNDNFKSIQAGVVLMLK